MKNDVLEQLEIKGHSLEPSVAERDRINQQAFRYIEAYLNGVDSSPAYLADESASLQESIPFSEGGNEWEAVLGALEHQIDGPGIATTSPRFFGYVPGGGLYHAAVADMLAAVTNKYASVFFASPGAVKVEDQCLAFLADMAGYPSTFGGYLSSGGSLANFTAVVTARDYHEIEGEKIGKAVVYLTEHAHHCIDKALHLAGLSKCIVRRIPVDDRFRMNANLLERQIQEDIASGLNPFFVVASAGTTNTGSIDPLQDVGRLAKKAQAWYHIDGAYGALFALCDEGKQRLKGLELSDSIVMDPHKTMFLPYGIGALLVRNKDHLLAAHAAGADYMQDVIHVEATSPATLSPELTKHFRGLRMWLPLQLIGVAPFRAALEEKLVLAQYFHRELEKLDQFEVGPEPDLSIVTYRFLPRSGDPDKFNQRLVTAIHADGRIFVSSTKLNGTFMLRLAVVCFRTHRRDVDVAIEVLKELSTQLEAA